MNIEEILCADRESFSAKMDATMMQDSFSWRATTIARELALFIVNQEGKIEKAAIEEALLILETKRFSLQPGHHDDADYLNHITSLLVRFSKEKTFSSALMRLTAPHENQGATRLIRATLQCAERTIVGDRETRRAACAVLFCYLRQNVGSCFATAPAIRIQQEDPHQLLADLGMLFGSKKTAPHH